MGRTSSIRNKLLRKMLRSGLSLLKAIFKIISQVFRGLVGQILTETFFWIATLGLAYLLVTWGIPQAKALYIAIAISLGAIVFAVCILYKSYRENKPSRNEQRSEIKLAHWVAQTFASKSSREWTEYQDWLHDIILSRQQLLDAKYPRWKVKLITYWRLSTFCLVVGISKLRQVAAHIRRSRS